MGTLYPYLPSALHVFDEHAFRVPAAWAYEDPEIESQLPRLHLRKVHLRDAFWAPRAIVHGRVCKRVFELQHVQHDLHRAAQRRGGELPLTSIAMKNPGRVAWRGQGAAGAFIVGTATRYCYQPSRL